MNLVISTAWFPVGVGPYLDRAARRAGHNVMRAGPSTGGNVGWVDVPEDQRIRLEYAIRPDITSRDMERSVARDCDLWIDVDGGFFNDRIAAKPKRRVLVVTDPHCEGGWTGDKARPHVDQVFMMQSPYTRPGDAWLPYAFDPEWHFPDATVTQTHDVTNIGASYDTRIEITEKLRAAGLKVLGPGRGFLGDDYRRALCSAELAIVWPLKDDLPARVFEALACGRRVVSGVNPDTRKLIVDCAHGVEQRDTVERVIATTISLLTLGPRSETCRKKCLAAVAPNTWDARLAQIINGRLAP